MRAAWTQISCDIVTADGYQGSWTVEPPSGGTFDLAELKSLVERLRGDQR